MDNMELLNSPSDTSLPKIPVLTTPNTNTYQEKLTPVIGIKKLDRLIKYIEQDQTVFLQPSDKNMEINTLLNRTFMNKDDPDDADDMTTWFRGNIKYSFVFMFFGSIIGIFGFACLIMLCYKHRKLQQVMTYFVTTTPVEALQQNKNDCQNDKMFLHLFFTLLILGLYCLIIFLKKMYRHFSVYNTFLNFRRGHGLATGPRADLVLEFCNLQNDLLVHIGLVRTLIPLILVSVDSVYPSFSIKPGYGLNYYLQLTVSFIFNHYDCKHNIPSKTKFKLEMFQKLKSNNMLKGHYLE